MAEFTIIDSNVNSNRWNCAVEMWNNKKMCDLEFTCSDGGIVKAHSTFLYCAGFHIGASNYSKVTLPYCSEIVEKIIAYCYTGRLELKPSEFVASLNIFRVLQAKKLFGALLERFGANMESFPSDGLNDLPKQCLQYLISKSGKFKDYWMPFLIEWVNVDKIKRSSEFIELITHLSGSDQTAVISTDLCYNNFRAEQGIDHLIKKRTDFSPTNAFYFKYVDLLCYNGETVSRSNRFPLEQNVVAIIPVSVNKQICVALFGDKTAKISQKNISSDLSFKVAAYSDNPPILALEDGRFLKVLETEQNSENAIFCELPELKALIPEVPEDNSLQYMQFVGNKMLVLRSDLSNIITHMCPIYVGAQRYLNQWKWIGEANLHFIDEHKDGLIAKYCGYSSPIRRMTLHGNELRAGGVLQEIEDYCYIYPSLSSPGYLVVKNDYSTFSKVRIEA